MDDRRAAVVDWTPHPEMEVFEQSVEDYVKDRDFGDLVIHAASPVGPAGILGLAGDIIQQIVEPTSAVCDACNTGDGGVPLIHISTSEVYNASGVNSEGDDLIAPSTPSARGEYAVGKIAAEYIVRQRSRLDGFPALVIRPFNVAGARQPREKGFVIPTFVEQALAGEPLTVFGKGDQKRSFMSVADFCRFVAIVTEPQDAEPFSLRHAWPRVVNVGNANNVTTIDDLAYRISGRVGTHRGGAYMNHISGNDVHGPEWSEAAGYHKVPDTLAARTFGWEPLDDLDAIIDATAGELTQVEALAA